jgi:hypothetical protein
MSSNEYEKRFKILEDVQPAAATTTITANTSNDKLATSPNPEKLKALKEAKKFGSYVPPSLSADDDIRSDFVTSPPKQRGLTTGISTLFRKTKEKTTKPKETNDSAWKSSQQNAANKAALGAALGGVHDLQRKTSRVFSNDDSDDSYESRVSQARSKDGKINNDADNDADDDDDDDNEHNNNPIRRYRGFSTSLKSLFLDESIVCASMGCFGLLISQRTEFLLDIRSRQRGASRRAANKSVHRYPSRFLAYSLFVTLLLMGGSFVIFGFGSNYNSTTSSGAASSSQNTSGNDDTQVYSEAADDDGRDNGGRSLRKVHLYSPVRAFHHYVWNPFFTLLHNEWYRDDEHYDTNHPHHRKLNSESTGEKDYGSTIRTILGFMFLAILGVIGRRRRMRTRYLLLRARAQEDHLYNVSRVDAKIDSNEGNYEGGCSHTLCGCYPVDPPITDETTTPNTQTPNSTTTTKAPKYEDCVSRGFQYLMAGCCGVACRCWFQCCSICALAQEAREVRLLLHPKFQRIDYITHQPFSEYQEAVTDLRRAWRGKSRRKSGITPHIQALSLLSRYILITFGGSLLILSATLLFNPRASFSWPDLVVLLATFVQAFLVLYVVHWIFHKSDLSLDAVVKFFAAGFAIAVPTAFILEGFLTYILLLVTYSLYGIFNLLWGQGFSSKIENHYRFFWIVGELINAFVVAAITEELCKYYTFRCVEHPDLVFLTGLNRNEQANDAVVGGVINYPYGSHQVQQLNRNISFQKSPSTISLRSTRSTVSATQEWIDKIDTNNEFHEEEDNEIRTHRQRAAALTTGMISVAVGLACAENFIYVFFMGGTGVDGDGSVKEEWIVLFFRSIFPVHALAAAMQSIGMIQKFVECTTDKNNHRIGVGRIVLPAVILHGSFDSILLAINVYIESAWDKYYQDTGGDVVQGVLPYNPIIVDTVAWLGIIGIMVGSILWYFREHRKQMDRLREMEQEEMEDAEMTFQNPDLSHPPMEIEIS